MTTLDSKNGAAPNGMIGLDAEIVKAAKAQANYQIATYTQELSLEFGAVFAAIAAKERAAEFDYD